MIKSSILSINILALTAGLESTSFCLAAVHHSPVSVLLTAVLSRKKFLISVNSNKDLANPQSHGKQAGHNHFRVTFYTLMLPGSNALPELSSIKTLTVQNVQLGTILLTGAAKPEIAAWLQNFKCHIGSYVLSICAKHNFVQLRSQKTHLTAH